MKPRRHIAFLLALPILGVALSHCVAGAAPARSSAARPAARAAADSNRVLVRLGRETITRGDVQRRINELPEQFRANYSTPEGRQQLLERLVEEKVWMMRATRAGIPSRPEIQRQLEQQRRDLVIRAYINDMMSANPAPSDSEAQAYFDSHVSEYRVPATVTVRHIQTRNQADAKRVLAYAKAKQDWNKLVLRYSADTLTRANGGLLGTVTKEGAFAAIGSQPALAESAFALGDGHFGGPYRTDRGWHVLKVETVKPETTRPFEQVRPVIMRQLGSQRSQDYYRSKLDEARRSLGVTPDSSAIKDFISQRKNARELFKEAQEAGPPEKRIELYQSVLREYPDSEVSPQAQFMVGFIYSEELKNYDAAEKAFRELLKHYAKSELAASAQWMVDHMRNEDAPSFIHLEADSSAKTAAPQRAGRSSSGKP